LALRGPGDKVLTKKHHVAQSGLTIVGTTHPVSISVDDELKRRSTTKVVIEGVLEVAKDTLHSSEMRLKRIMQVEAHLLDRLGDVRPSEGEVLESPSQAPVGSQVTDMGTRVGGDLGLSVHEHGTMLAIGIVPNEPGGKIFNR
jgi:hypothetical protein